MGFYRIPKIELSTVAAIFLLSSISWAQSAIDPSSALLLDGGSAGGSRTRANEPRLDSGRYTVRPRSQPATEKVPAERIAPVKKPPTEVVQPTTNSPTPVSAAPVVLAPNEEGSVILDEASGSEEGAVNPITALGHRLIDLSVGTVYLYQASESSYSYRNSTIAAPAFSVAAKIWFSSQFAIGGRYLSTFGGHVPEPDSSNLAATIAETAYGVYLRNSFSNSNLTFGIEYQDSSLGLASETTSRVKTKSRGVRIAIEGEFQSTETSSWAIGFAANPKLQHEESAAATQVQSGTDVNAYSLEASIERRWKFDSNNALFVRLEHKVERDLFTGSASVADPIGGVTPNGVAVTIGKTLIQFGYNWGN